MEGRRKVRKERWREGEEERGGRVKERREGRKDGERKYKLMK